jgi:phosphate transport system substrate-binding protein
MTTTLRTFALALLLGWLAACGDSGDRETAPPMETPAAEAPAATEATPPEAAPAEAAEAPAAAQDEGGGPVSVDPGVPAYQSRSGIAGNLSSIGSDTLNNLMTLWSEGFGSVYPSVRVQVEGKGSSTAPPALIGGTAQLGPMSRHMKPSEIDAFDERYGYPPTEVRVAIDALAVYVSRENPLQELTLPEVDAIFSKNRTCGRAEPLRTWGDLGLSGALAARPIRLYGRNSASGTYGYFKEVAGTTRTR